MNDSILEEQMAYYRARAGEYDEWFLRQGRYDDGADSNRVWHTEVQAIRDALNEFRPDGAVLEIAGGTGLWTQQLADFTVDLTVVDASAEVLAINRERLANHPVNYLQSDIFSYAPDRTYDVVFFSFWLSHVPDTHFDSFWKLVEHAIAPGGRVFLIDSQFVGQSPARVLSRDGLDDDHERRSLKDGRTFRIVKRYFDADDLTARLTKMGWRADLRTTPTHFLFGSAKRA